MFSDPPPPATLATDQHLRRPTVARVATVATPSGVEAESSNPYVLISPFVDRARLVAVLVNTSSTANSVTITLEGSTFSGALTGEQSRADVRWQTLPPVEIKGSSVTLELPGWSVTTVAAPLQ